MKAEKSEDVIDILADVLQKELSERSRYLDDLKLKPEILAEVKSLLELHDESGDFMSLSAGEISQDFFPLEEPEENSFPGQQIGIYKIIREIGLGGMGAVYLATRADGKFEQKVALKMLKRELNVKKIRDNFEREREILSRLEHPFIARLLDAGTTADGIPFIAMEYVEGMAVDDYCTLQNLDLTQRLELFRKICSAVGFAHRNLIVHRDLKPSNILVTKDGEPKLLDFGISKIISPEYEQINAATITKLGAMTPAYASPEQLQNKSVTTATDIYSLGVILYELLSGRRPFENKEADFKEIVRAVLEQEPAPPSETARTILKVFKERTAAETETKPFKEHLTKQTQIDTKQNEFRATFSSHTSGFSANSLRGDLDNIVLKALRKEPERRYTSAENFAEDIERHQNGLPVTARPNTFAYRAEKFFKRNRAGVVAGIFIFLAIAGGISATLWQARAAQIERERAERRFGDVRKLANSYLFDVYPEIENLEGSLKAREKIITNALSYLDSLSKEASGDLELQDELATAYEKIGDVQGALKNSSLGNVQAGLESYRKAQILREAILAANPNDLEAKTKLADNYYTTARTLWNDTQTAAAEAEFEKALKLRRELTAAQPDSTEAKNDLAVLLIDYGAIPVFNSQTGRALILFEEALGIIENLRKNEPENADFKKTLGRLLRIMSKAKASNGDYEGGIEGFAQASAISRELAREFPADFRLQRAVWLTDSLLCELYIDKRDGQKAVETCVPTIEFPKNALEKEPENGVVAYDLAISHFNSARAFRLSKDYRQTIEQAGKALVVMSRLSEKEPENMDYRRNLAIYQTETANAQIEIKQTDNAEENLRQSINTLTAVVEKDKSATLRQDLADAYRLYAKTSFARGDKTKAVELIDKAIEIVRSLQAANELRDTNKNFLAELERERSVYVK